MGIWRTLYNIIGLDYIGSKEQEITDRQKHLKFMVCKQVESGGLKLKSTNNKELFISKVLKKRKKKGINKFIL